VTINIHLRRMTKAIFVYLFFQNCLGVIVRKEKIDFDLDLHTSKIPASLHLASRHRRAPHKVTGKAVVEEGRVFVVSGEGGGISQYTS
jgi:hypothetical protein